MLAWSKIRYPELWGIKPKPAGTIRKAAPKFSPTLTEGVKGTPDGLRWLFNGEAT